ncbi:MAG: hypothetical protein Q9181_007557, partial [Wetmoreana brouardii]
EVDTIFGEASNANGAKRTENPETSHTAGQYETLDPAENAELKQKNGGAPLGGSDAEWTDTRPSGETGASVSHEAASSTSTSQANQEASKPQAESAEIGQSKQHNSTSTDSTSPFRILDALSASGLRALRYAKEIHHVTSVTANDLSPSATASIKLNIDYNGVAQQVHPATGDAKALMYHAAMHGKDSYQVIDLDPYGTAVPFLDAAVQAVPDGGLLCVTCTDAGVFASVGWPEKTFSQYGGLPWKGPQNHEAGLRLVLNAIATSAAPYGLTIEPLLSLNIDFYVRLFVRIRRSAADVKFFASKTMIVYNCDNGCSSFSIQYLAQRREREAKNGDKFYTNSLAQGPSTDPYCVHCGFKTHVAGPMWGGPLHNPHFISRILDLLPSLDSKVYGTIPRIEGMLTLALNETLWEEPIQSESANAEPFPPLDPARRDPHPFFVNPSVLARTIHTSVPSEAALRGALISLGYRTTRSHTEAGSIRTDAPWHVIWEIMREWARQKHPIKEGALKEGMAGWEIMRKDRSRRQLEDAKDELKIVLEKAEDLAGLRVGVESALHRITKKSRSATTVDGEDQNGLSTHESEDRQRRELKIVFDERLGKEAVGKKLLRYQMNPRPDWGPMIIWRPLVASVTLAVIILYSWLGRLIPDLSDSPNFQVQAFSNHDADQHQKHLQPIPKKIWQINLNHPRYTSLEHSVRSWKLKNPSHSHKLLDDEAGNRIVRKQYSNNPEVLKTYLELESTILRADYLRYLVLAVQGGIYSDLDTNAIKAIDDWLPNSDNKNVRAIIGVEYDQLDAAKPPKGLYMPIQFCQWTIAISAHHPLMLSMVISVTHGLQQLARSRDVTLTDLQPADDKDVLFTTGPVKWTWEVFAYLSFVTGTEVTHRNLTGLSEPRRFGDVLILPINAFATGLGYAGSRTVNTEETLIRHTFQGSWKANEAKKPISVKERKQG